MKIKEFLEKLSGDRQIKIVYEDRIISSFDGRFWETIAPAVLNLQIRSIKCGGGIVIESQTDIPVIVESIEALQAAADSDEIKAIALGSDIIGSGEDRAAVTFKSSMKAKTLDLNGFNIYAPDRDGEESVAILAQGDAVLDIFDSRGSGSVVSTLAASFNGAVVAEGSSEVYIHGGLFAAGDAEDETRESATISAGDSSKIEIYGGFFHNDNWEQAGMDGQNLVLDVEDGAEATIRCFGGLFHGQNPIWGDNSGDPATFLADGYASVDIQGINALIYRVIPIL